MATEILQESDTTGKRGKRSPAYQRVETIKQRCCRPGQQDEALAEECPAYPGRTRKPTLYDRICHAQPSAVYQMCQKANPGNAAGTFAYEAFEHLQIAGWVMG